MVCTAYPARAARRSDCGGWPKARMEALRIAKAGGLRDVLDRLAGGLHALPRHLDPQPLDGVAPVSAMKARAKCRELMPACPAMSLTVSGASRCSRAQASSGAQRPPAPWLVKGLGLLERG
jgi:hypothetical protein